MRKFLERRGWLRSASDQEREALAAGVTDGRGGGVPKACTGPGSGTPEAGAAGTFGAGQRTALQLPMVEPLLLTTVQVSTFQGDMLLTRASGFFFRKSRSLFLVTSRHVLFDPGSGHLPDAISFNVHTAATNLALTCPVRLPLYAGGLGLWRQGRDSSGDVDVAVLEVHRDQLPRTAVMHVFSEEHLLSSFALADVGAPLLLVGFPLGFHDTLHQLPVVRHAVIASSFGLRFQGLGCFLTDGRAHRGSSGAPVVLRASVPHSTFPWRLVGVHSSRFDMGSRDIGQDESLGLNCAWYADILTTLSD